MAGATSLALGPYTFITANSGLGPTNISGITLATPVLNVGGNPYHLTLTASTPTSEILNVFTGSAFPVNAYWNGSQSSNWTTLNGGTMPASNWSTDHTGATDTNEIPGTETNVFFTIDSGAQHLNTTLGENYMINSLNFTGGATVPLASSVTISGFNITIVAGPLNGNTAGSGITVASGSGAHTIASNVILGASQTWSNSSTNPLTVSGVISDGGNDYTLTTAGPITLSGVNTYSGGTVINSGVLNINADAALGTAAHTPQPRISPSAGGNAAPCRSRRGRCRACGRHAAAF